MGFGFPADQLSFWLVGGALAIFALAAALRHLENRRARRLDAFVRSDLASRLLVGYDEAMRRPMTWFVVSGFFLLILALAQPHWGRSWQQVRQHSRDILICLDTSESMNGQDILPSRLERAKQKVDALLDAAPGDRFGLVAFAGGAALQCPLTLDHGYFKAVLAAIDTDSISMEGTNIAAALQEAANAFQDDERGAKAKPDARIVLLISDGEEVEGRALDFAAQHEHNMRLYVMGVGDPAGAEIRRPSWMGRYVPVSEMAEAHVSRLDEQNLMALALAGGGRYVRSTPDDYDLSQLLEHLENVAGREREGERRFRLVNRYQWPLALATLCFAAEGLWIVAMPWIRRRRAERRVAAEGTSGA